MSRALLLNAGASWAGYQMGAIEHLVRERGVEFDQVVGCGIGAMNGAFVACGAVDELADFWDRISVRRLVRPSMRPWRALAVNTPQRRFVERHVSERAIEARGVTFALTTFDLWSGEEIVHRYPGDPMPIVDAIMAAVATPGLVRSVASGDRLLAEATLIDSVPVAALAPADEVVAVLAGAPLDWESMLVYRTWRAVAARAIEINLAQDSRRAIDRFAASATWRSDVDALLADLRSTASAIGTAIDDVARELGPSEHAPSVTTITPSSPLGYPLWRFPKRAVRAARELGRRDASEAWP